MKRILLLCGFSLSYAYQDDLLAGKDTDDNGCNSTAGYTWCGTKSKCIRAWNETCESEIEDQVAEDRDEFGCIKSAEIAWCEKLGKCMRLCEVTGDWSEVCELDNSDASTGDKPSSEDDDGGYYYHYDRKAEVRNWLIQFFAVAGPLLVCIPVIALHSRRRRRSKRKAYMLEVVARDNRDVVNYVQHGTIAVKQNSKTAGPDYNAVSNFV
jgi:hypothetical protein